MTDAKGPPPEPPGQRGRRRPATTIDLTATELSSEPVAKSEPVAEPVPATVEATPPEPLRSAAAEMPPDPPPPDSPSAEPPLGEDGPQPSRGPALAGLPANLPWRLIGAAAVGAALMFVLAMIAGLLTNRPADTSALDSRIAGLEQQVRELADRPPPVSADSSAANDLKDRITRIETTLAMPRAPVTEPAIANRFAKLEGDVKALSESIAAIGRRSDDAVTTARDAREHADANAGAIADLTQRMAQPAGPPPVARGDVDALANRIPPLERSTRALQTELAKRAAGGTDPALRLALVAAALKSAVEAGDPFAAELDAAKSLDADAQALAPLEPFASSGAPPAAALTRELEDLLPSLAQIVGAAPPDSGFIERLRENARKIVRVRPAGDVAGDDPAAVVARIEARAAQADIEGALAEIAKLPSAARAKVAPWVAKAEARNAAVESSRKLAADTLAALGRSSP